MKRLSIPIILALASLMCAGCTTSQFQTDKWLPDEAVVAMSVSDERVRTRVVHASLYLKATGLATTSVQAMERKHIDFELVFDGDPGFWSGLGSLLEITFRVFGELIVALLSGGSA